MTSREYSGAPTTYTPYRPGHVRRRSSTTSAPSSTTLLLPPLRSPVPTSGLGRSGTAVQHRRAVIRTTLFGAVAFVTLAAILLLPQRWNTIPAEAVLPGTGPSMAEKPLLQEEARVPPKRPRPHQAVKVQHGAESTIETAPDASGETAGPTRKGRPPRLPICEKTAVFRFAGLHGFGSEMTLMYRMAAVAAHFGYEVVLDDTRWNYGAWSDYFSPLALQSSAVTQPASPAPRRCRLPKEGTKRAKIVLTADELRALSGSSTPDAPFTPKWTARSHVLWSSRDMDGLDLTYLHLFANSPDLESLRRADLELAAGDSPLFLSPEQTLPPAYERAFSQSSWIAGQAWQLDEGLSRAVEAMQSTFSVSGNPQRGGSGDASAKAGDVAIAMHVRLGDKFLEIDRVKSAQDTTAATEHTATPGLSDKLVAAYFAAAIDSVHSLAGLSQPDDTESDPFEPRWIVMSRADTSEGKGAEASIDKPLLVLMSDDQTAVDVFRRHPLAEWFRIISPSEVAFSQSGSDEAAGKGLERKTASTRRSRRGHHDPIPAGFNEIKFNRLPLAARIESTRSFVRDLTFLARTADALVVTGSSNVGRLLMMLFEAQGKAARRRSRGAGLDASEPVGGEGAVRPQRRREMRSLDTRWFPTARYT